MSTFVLDFAYAGSLSFLHDDLGMAWLHKETPVYQYCPNMVDRSPNATYKLNGRPIVTRKVVRFATNEFPKNLSPTPFHISDIETGPLFTKLLFTRLLS